MPNRDRIVAVRLTDEEYQRLEQIAKRRDRKVAELAYLLLREYLAGKVSFSNGDTNGGK